MAITDMQRNELLDHLYDVYRLLAQVDVCAGSYDQSPELDRVRHMIQLAGSEVTRTITATKALARRPI